MAIIVCTECDKEFSDKASICPNCGCPTSEVLIEIKAREELELNLLSKKTKSVSKKFFNEMSPIDINRNTVLSTTSEKMIIIESQLYDYSTTEITANEIDSIVQNYSIQKKKGNIVINYGEKFIILMYGSDDAKFKEIFNNIAQQIEVDFIENFENPFYEIENESKSKRSSNIFKTIEKTRIIDTDSRKSLSSSIIKGSVAGWILGPIGLLGGSLSAKNRKSTTFLIFFTDGSRKTVTVRNNGFDYKRYIRYLE